MAILQAPDTAAQPAAEHLLPRPRVVDRLEAAIDRPVVLVEAPAGYGKTCAVLEWMRHTADRRDYTWVDVHRTGNEPRRLVQLLADGLGDSPGTLLDLPPEAAIDRLIEDVRRRGGEVVTVLDGVDAADDGLLLIVRRLVESLPSGWHLVLTARLRPSIGVPRLRSWLAIAEVGPNDLRFDVAEAGTLLHTHLGLDVAPATVVEVTRRLDGWPAGLLLAGLAAREVDDPDAALARAGGDHPDIDAYLTSEVLPTIDADLCSFLVDTAPLERLGPALCETATGRTDVTRQLRALQSWPWVGIEYTDTGSWLRLHHLLRDWLRAVAKRTQPQRFDLVLDRAARWCVHNDLLDDALTYAVQGHQPALLAWLVRGYGDELLGRGQQERLLTAIESLPRRLTTRDPELLLLGADSALRLGERERFEALRSTLRVEADDRTDDRRRALGRGRRMLDVLAELDEGHLTAAHEAANGLLDDDLAAPPGAVHHLGWDGRRARRLAEVTAFLGGRTVGGSVTGGHGPADVASAPLAAVLACQAGDDERARTLARDVLGDEAPHPSLDDVVELLLAALARAWTDDDRGALEAHELAADLTNRRRWWLADLVSALTAAETERRSHRWRSVRKHLERARQTLETVPDPGAVPVRLLEQQLRRMQLADTPTVPRLTERELDILRQLVTQGSRRELAESLYVSPNTVKTHLRSVYRKLGVATREQAIARGRDLGLLDPS